MCVSCRKSNTVTGPGVRASTSFRLSGVNSPLPEASQMAQSSCRRRSPLFSLSRIVSRTKFRGKAFASLSRCPQINTGESASAGRTGRVLFASARGRKEHGASTKKDKYDLQPTRAINEEVHLNCSAIVIPQTGAIKIDRQPFCKDPVL